MAKRSAPVITGEDTTILPQSVDIAMKSYIGQPRVSDVIMELGGDKSKLAMELAGTSDKKSTAYKSQYRSIGRWLKAESGAGGQSRRPSADAQEKFKQIIKKNRPPTGGTVDMEGYIYYDYDVRWRHITVTLNADQVAKMLAQIEARNTHGAYGEIFAAYGAAHLEMGADGPPSIDIDFS